MWLWMVHARYDGEFSLIKYIFSLSSIFQLGDTVVPWWGEAKS